MSLPETHQRIYQELALRYERQNDGRLRDVFYLLAADVAYSAGRHADADKIHREMIEVNPNSIVQPFSSFRDALQSMDIQDYLADLRRQFPPDEAEKLLTKIRANPLGQPSDVVKKPSQRDTQEVIPMTARTVTIPAPKVAPRKSPYEHTPAPAPAAPAEETSSFGPGLSMLWLCLVGVLAAGLMVWTFVRPFWEATR